MPDSLTANDAAMPATAGQGPQEAEDALCDPYLAALSMTSDPASIPPRKPRATARKGTRKPARTRKASEKRASRKSGGTARPGKTTGRRGTSAKGKGAASGGSAVPLPAAPEPLTTPAVDPPWGTETTPLPRSRALTRFNSQGLFAHFLGWLGESLRPVAPHGRRGLSPSYSAQALEIERLRAENAALHRQIEALLALRESESRGVAAPH